MKPSYLTVLRRSACVVMAVLALAGCAKKEPAETAAAGANPAEKRHPLRGEIVTVKAAERVLIIHHQAIPDYMPEMTMEFHVGPGDAANARAGQRIRGELIVRDGEPWLEKIWPDDTVTNTSLDAAANALAQDTAMRGRSAYREVGETMPDFTLLDQEGRPVSINRFRGKQVVLNFIFTRCPIATMCPAATLRMSALQKAARAAGVRDLELISISFDPAYDTPGVLKEYAATRGLDLGNWSFLTGPDAAVRQLLAQMGIIREFEGETIKHTLATLLLDEQGRIVYRADGSQWEVADFVSRMKRG